MTYYYSFCNNDDLVHYYFDYNNDNCCYNLSKPCYKTCCNNCYCNDVKKYDNEMYNKNRHKQQQYNNIKQQYER